MENQKGSQFSYAYSYPFTALDNFHISMSEYHRSIKLTTRPQQEEKPKRQNYSLSGEVANQKTSTYRGVTRRSDTNYGANVWDNTHNIYGQKGKTVYIGGYETEIEAARAHDLVAIKIWGTSTRTNFPVDNYSKEISQMQSMSKRDWILAVRTRNKNIQDLKASRNETLMNNLAKLTSFGRKKDKRACARKDQMMVLDSGLEDIIQSNSVKQQTWNNNYNLLSPFDPYGKSLQPTSTIDLTKTAADHFLDGLYNTNTSFVGIRSNNTSIGHYRTEEVPNFMTSDLQEQVFNVSGFSEDPYQNQLPPLHDDMMSFSHLPFDLGNQVEGNMGNNISSQGENMVQSGENGFNKNNDATIGDYEAELPIFSVDDIYEDPFDKQLLPVHDYSTLGSQNDDDDISFPNLPLDFGISTEETKDQNS